MAERRFVKLSGTSKFVLILYLASGAYAQTPEPVTIALEGGAIIVGEDIFFSDIADISPVTGDLRLALETLVIGPAPMPGRERDISQSVVKLRLRQNDLDEKVRLTGAARVKVSSASKLLTGAKLEEMVRKFVTANLYREFEGLTVELMNPPKEIVLPVDEPVISFQSSNGLIPKGRSVVHLYINKGRRYAKRIPITVNTRTFEKVLVTSRQISRNSDISESDVKIELRETTSVSDGDYFSSLMQVLDKVSTRGISPNRILRKRMLDYPSLISRGAKLTLLIKARNFTIRTIGMAREDGQLDEFIEVQPMPSGKRIKARVVDGSTVMVEM